jgi:hypothetical protein
MKIHLVISTICSVGLVVAATTPCSAQVCQDARDGVFVQQDSDAYSEVIPAEGDGGTHTITTSGVVRYYPSTSPRLAWLYDPDTWWETQFIAPSTEVWIQFNGCDSNDGVAEIYIDGQFACEYNTDDKGKVLVVLSGLRYDAHTVRIQTRSLGEPERGDVSLDYIALPYRLKMHFPQRPDEAGWDVNATNPAVVADDWRCPNTGNVDRICFWGSWRGGVVGVIDSFHLSVHDDNPDPDGAGPLYSMPGDEQWNGDFTDFTVEQIDPPVTEGWFDPVLGVVTPDDHQQYFRYCVDTSRAPFVQTEGEIYWLDISATVADPVGTHWGWKTSQDVWNDDSVWGVLPGPAWGELYEPLTPPTTDTFNVIFDEFGGFVGGVGSDPDFPDWYEYPVTDWWNVWFFDHPFDWNRHKLVYIHVDVDTAGPGAFLTLAVNWSRYPWSLQETPPVGPPLPGDVAPLVCQGDYETSCVDDGDCSVAEVEGPCGPYLEELYIGREVLFEGPVTAGQPIDMYWVWPNYNPEWVSIDVRGQAFGISGSIQHRCTRSLNQAFEIYTDSQIPTITEWGVAVMTLLLLSAATVVLVRRRAATA